MGRLEWTRLAWVGGLVSASGCLAQPSPPADTGPDRILVAQAGAGTGGAGGVRAAPAERLPVTGFRVSGNTLLPQGSVEATLAPFKGERTLDELKQAAAALQAAYGRAGYGGVVAFLPGQALNEGVVSITVIEGRLADIMVGGNRQFSADNVRASLPALASGQVPRLSEIDRQIQLANENPAKETQVLLRPGQQPGQVDARVTIVERPVQRISVGLDNTGNDRTGNYRASLGWQHANMLDRDHVASVQLQGSPDEPKAVKVISGAYRVPFYARGLTLDTYAAYSDVDGGNTATFAGNLTFNGRGRVLGARLAGLLPRVGDWDQRLAVGLDHRAYLNSCRINGLGELCGNDGANVSVQPAMIEYSAQRGGTLPVGLMISVVHNLQFGGGDSGGASFERVRPGATPRYTALRVGASGAIGFAEDWQLRARFSGQWTNDGLVPGEQFGIGGAASVRGYEERELAGDSGALLSFELVGPELARGLGIANGSLRPQAFIDGGWVSNRLGTACLTTATSAHEHCSLASAGFGARFQFGDLQARIHLGHALKTAARTARGDTRVHLALSYSF